MKNLLKTLAADAWVKTVGGRGDFRQLKSRTSIILEDEIPNSICDDIIRRINHMADNPDDRVWQDKVGSDTRILAFESVISDHLHYLRVPDRVKAIDAYLGIKTRSWFLMANRVLPKSGNLGSGGGIHRDSPFSHQVKCIWYLSNVDSGNGPFQYVPGSHFSAIADRKKYPIGEIRFDAAEDPVVDALAPAGSLLVSDTKCIHGGKPIEVGARYAITLYTYSSTNKTREVYRDLGVDVSRLQA